MKAQHPLRRGFVFLLLGLSISALAATSASAQIIYDNGVGTTGKGLYAEASDGAGYDISAGDVFTAGTTGTVNAVDFSGEYYSGSPETGDVFALNLYSASTVTGPGALIVSDTFSSYTQLQVGTHTIGGTTTMLPVYQFDGSLQQAFTLTAGTTYYFSISDLTSTGPDNFAVVYSDNQAGGSNLEYSAAGGTAGGYDMALDGATLAFQLKDVPEPSEWALLIFGAVGIVLARRFGFNRGAGNSRATLTLRPGFVRPRPNR